MQTNRTIWILEDDPDALFIYQEILELRYKLRTFENLGLFQTALGNVTELGPPDLVIADLRLPDGNFLEFLGRGPTCPLQMPFIVVSSCEDLDILRACFEEEARDYLTKPFTRNELIVKLERHLKPKVVSPVLRTGSVSFDPVSLKLKRGCDVVAQLTAKELQLFSVLQQAKGKPVSRKDLLCSIWNNVSVSEKTLDVHLFNLRKKLSVAQMEIRFLPPNSYLLLGDWVDH